MRVSYVIVFVSDMSRSVAFYRDVLELPLRFETTHWTEFSTPGATLALHLEAPDPERSNPAYMVAGTSRPGLSVPDLAAFHQRMMDRQVPCMQEPRDLFGARIAQYLDPDGLVISVSEERRQ
jgi:catechol 2,3-dioxygenase-like lactoylglutathione lyase family enzyme